MGDNFNGGNNHLSNWFGMNSNQQHQQQEHPQQQRQQQQHQLQQQQQSLPQQYREQTQQMMQAPMMADRNMFNPSPAPQHQQVEEVSMNNQTYYPTPQYEDQASQQQTNLTHSYPQAYQQQDMYQQQVSPQQYPQHQQQQHFPNQQQQNLAGRNSSAMDSSRGSNNSFPSSMMNNFSVFPPQQQNTMRTPHIRTLQAHQNSIDVNVIRASTVMSGGINATPEDIATAKSRLRSERKRTREKQRRDGVNKQFAELTRVLKRLEVEEREEAVRKARLAAGTDSSLAESLHSVRLPFIAPNNSVDLIACAIVHLQHLHRMSRKQQESINRLHDEMEAAKKSGEDTATKLKEVLFNFPTSRPHPGMTNPTFNVGNTASSSNSNVINMGMNNNSSDPNRMMVNANNGNSNLAMNATSSTSMSTGTTMAGGSQQKPQVVMMVPVMMNANGTATIMGQATTCNMPGMAMQPVPGVSSPSNTIAMQGTCSMGNSSSSGNIPQNPSPQQQPIPTEQQQQQQPLRGDTANDPKAPPSDVPPLLQQQPRQQPMAVQVQQQHLQQQIQPISRTPQPETDASVQQQQQLQKQSVTKKNSSLPPSAVPANSQASLEPQHQMTESKKPPSGASLPAEGFAVALASALSNLRGGNSQEGQQQQQQQQLEVPARASAISQLSHTVSSSAHAAALGAAVAETPAPNTMHPAAETSTKESNVSSAPEGTPRENHGDGS